VPSLLSGWQPACGAGTADVGAGVEGSGCGLLDDGEEDGPDDPLADALGDPACDACAEAENEVVGLLALLLTHPTTVMIITKASGGAAIKNGIRRQKGFGPSRSGLPVRCSSLTYSPKPHRQMRLTLRA
jgi:hypothetical protein